jgi:hypothetical protein
MERPVSDIASTVDDILEFVSEAAQRMEIGEVKWRLLSLVMAAFSTLLGSSASRSDTLEIIVRLRLTVELGFERCPQ